MDVSIYNGRTKLYTFLSVMGKKETFEVIGICFKVSGLLLNPVWRHFKSYSNLNTIFSLQQLERKPEIHGLENYSVPIEQGEINIVRKETGVMITDKFWKRAYVLSSDMPEMGEIFCAQLFYTHAVQCQILYLHSSLIDYQGQGLMFLGPSGIGKTTQAELWNQYRDALIINGDVVFVQETPDAFLGWGTPWHGSSPYCENISVPVKALVVLKQASENSIRELTGFEKVTAVSNSVFYPRWLEGGMELCLETLDHLLTALPVYELSCRPDEDAVRLTEDKIFGNL